ncbi:MAG: DUF4349 domain-containing protein [Clostridia bacterium]|nr:DUF4349 domain-containing protein [Clostridia bacterium]
MKRKISVILAILLALCVLAGCGAGGGASYDAAKSENSAPAQYDTPADPAYDSEPEYANDSKDGIAGNGFIYQTDTDLASKIIYSAYLQIETTTFDDSLAALNAMLSANKAFLESSSTGGASYSDTYYGRQTYRTAEFTIRVPKENFSAMLQGMSEIGNVTRNNVYSENVTAQYTDTESRLATYRVEEERLLAMLEKAETVEDMLTIESRLSEVRYHIESLTSSLKNWDNLVNYSTITVYISEVKELTEQPELQRTYWQEIGDGLKLTLKRVGRFFKNFFRDLVVALPVIIVIAVVVILVIIILKAIFGKRRRADRRLRRRARKGGAGDPGSGDGN